MIENPEFRRNLWLELTPHRLIATPALLLLVCTLVVLQQEVNWRTGLSLTAVVLFMLFTILWGGRQAQDAALEELRERTWDTQRMSALSAWDMTVGKLLGGTIFQWYIGVYCLLIFLVCNDPEAYSLLRSWSTLQSCLLLVLSALLLQASGLLSGLSVIRSGRTVKASRSVPIAFIGLLIFLALAQAVLQHADQPIIWYGIFWPGQIFVLVSLAVFAGWACLGAFRLMSDLLAVRSIPWSALSFTVFLTVYLCGFIDEYTWGYASRFAAVGSIVGGSIVYVEAWKERRDWIAVKRFFRAWRQESLQHALEATPAWLVVALFTLAVSLVTGVLPSNRPHIPGLPNTIVETLTLSPTLFTLLMFRDIGLLYFFSLGDRPDRATSATLIYMIMLYIVLPPILNMFGMGFLAFPGFSSFGQGSPFVGILIAVVHVGVVAMLLRQRLGRL